MYENILNVIILNLLFIFVFAFILFIIIYEYDVWMLFKTNKKEYK